MAKAIFSIRYRAEAIEHMSVIEARHLGLIRSTLEQRLGHEPLVETRARKPMRPSLFGTGLLELRFGPRNCFRAFYRADDEARTVEVVALGIKSGNRFFFGGEELTL
jgi:hypothetical protein